MPQKSLPSRASLYDHPAAKAKGGQPEVPAKARIPAALKKASYLSTCGFGRRKAGPAGRPLPIASGDSRRPRPCCVLGSPARRYSARVGGEGGGKVRPAAKTSTTSSSCELSNQPINMTCIRRDAFVSRRTRCKRVATPFGRRSFLEGSRHAYTCLVCHFHTSCVRDRYSATCRGTDRLARSPAIA